MIHDAVEELGPVGSVPSHDVGPPNPIADAESIITGIIALSAAAEQRSWDAAVEACAKLLASHADGHRAELEGCGVGKNLTAEDKQLHAWAVDILETKIERFRALTANRPAPSTGSEG